MYDWEEKLSKIHLPNWWFYLPMAIKQDTLNLANCGVAIVSVLEQIDNFINGTALYLESSKLLLGQWFPQ